MWKYLCFLSALNIVYCDEKDFINFGGFVCPREEKALGRCLRDALNTYIPQLATAFPSLTYNKDDITIYDLAAEENIAQFSGVPEFGVPPCEPLIVPSLAIQQSAGPISITSSYNDVTVRGPSHMRVKHVEVESRDHQVVAMLYIPELRMKGNYNLKGQLLMLPIEGNGKFSAKYGDIDATVTIILDRTPRENAADALACKDLHVKFHIGDASMELDNLFGGDGDLGNAMNKFLNENWEKLLEELQVPMEEALRDFLKPLADHAFGTLNADDILQSK